MLGLRGPPPRARMPVHTCTGVSSLVAPETVLHDSALGSQRPVEVDSFEGQRSGLMYRYDSLVIEMKINLKM